jgi:hypothetical protein
VTDDDGDSDSASQSVTVTAPILPPAAPTNLTTSVQTTGKGKEKIITSVQLSWTDNSDNEDIFIIERCEQTGTGKSRTCIFYEFGSVLANVTSFSYIPVNPESGTYIFRVKARNAHGDSAYTNEKKI